MVPNVVTRESRGFPFQQNEHGFPFSLQEDTGWVGGGGFEKVRMLLFETVPHGTDIAFKFQEGQA